MIKRIVTGLFFLFLSISLVAKAVELNTEHPDKHTVKKGDTLWDISAMFLKYPWHWPDIWQVNPQIENPHLIYPGDQLSLVYKNGQPVIELNRGKRLVKLSPEVREIVLDKAISTIPLSALGPFLSKPRVVGEEVMDKAPYVVASADERLISGSGDFVYAKGLTSEDEDFSVFRQGDVYKDPDTGEILGYEAIHIGDAQRLTDGTPAKVGLQRTNKEVLIGDRLLPVENQEFEFNFIPRSPESTISGRIISVFDGVSQIGQFQVIVLNRGLRDGLEAGHVLSVYKAGETINDEVTEDRNDTVTLPDEHAGEAMVFKLYDKVSYAIVMKATRAMHVLDKVESAQ